MSRPRTGNKRERLIGAAVELFAEKGFFYTTTAEVSAHAGVAAGTLYLYFNSKDDLLVATLETFLDEFSLNVMPAVYSASRPGAKIQSFVAEYLRFLEERRDLAQVFFVELRQNNMALRTAAGRVWDRYHSVVRDLIKDVKREGGLRDIDVDAALSIVLGPIEFIATRWLLGHDDRTPTAHIESLSSGLFEHMVLGAKLAI